MTRSITHVIKFSLNDTFFFLILSLGTKRNPNRSASGVIELIG
jgi:hypothetical protein